MSIYSEAIREQVPLDHHESDLYLMDSPKARGILARHGKRVDGWNVQTFTSQIDGKRWLDVPFHYEPFTARWALRGKA